MGDNRVVKRSTFGRAISNIDCDRCGKTFNEIRALRRHQRDRHGPRINCRYCGADFARGRRYDLEIHEDKCRSASYRATGRFRIQRETRSHPVETETVPHRQRVESRSPRRPRVEEPKQKERKSRSRSPRRAWATERANHQSNSTLGKSRKTERPHTPQRDDPLLSSAATKTSSQTKPKSKQASPAKQARSQPTNTSATTIWSSEDPLGLDLQLSPDLSVDLSGNPQSPDLSNDLSLYDQSQEAMNLFTGLNLDGCLSIYTQSDTCTSLSSSLMSTLSYQSTVTTLTTPSISGLSSLLPSAPPVLPGNLFAAGAQTISLYTADGTPVVLQLNNPNPQSFTTPGTQTLTTMQISMTTQTATTTTTTVQDSTPQMTTTTTTTTTAQDKTALIATTTTAPDNAVQIATTTTTTVQDSTSQMATTTTPTTAQDKTAQIATTTTTPDNTAQFATTTTVQDSTSQMATTTTTAQDKTAQTATTTTTVQDSTSQMATTTTTAQDKTAQTATTTTTPDNTAQFATTTTVKGSMAQIVTTTTTAQDRTSCITTTTSAKETAQLPQAGPTTEIAQERSTLQTPKTTRIHQTVPQIQIPKTTRIHQTVPQIPKTTWIHQTVPQIQIPKLTRIHQMVPQVKTPTTKQTQQAVPRIARPTTTQIQTPKTTRIHQTVPQIKTPTTTQITSPTTAQTTCKAAETPKITTTEACTPQIVRTTEPTISATGTQSPVNQTAAQASRRLPNFQIPSIFQQNPVRLPVPKPRRPCEESAIQTRTQKESPFQDDERPSCSNIDQHSPATYHSSQLEDRASFTNSPTHPISPAPEDQEVAKAASISRSSSASSTSSSSGSCSTCSSSSSSSSTASSTSSSSDISDCSHPIKRSSAGSPVRENKRRRLEYDPVESLSQDDIQYSPTMPPYSPDAPSPAYQPTEINPDVNQPKFPPRPLHIPLNPARDRYSFLSYDPRTLFAGAPSSFMKSKEARFMSKARREALQIGVDPTNVKYCVEGHTMTKSEIVQKGDFFYKMTTTFSPLPQSARMTSTKTQTDEVPPRCSKNCHGCGRQFTCS